MIKSRNRILLRLPAPITVWQRNFVTGNHDRYSTMRDLFRSLLTAIIEADSDQVCLLLQEDKLLATRSITEGHYEARIAHWVYAQDTALHVAAAGGRLEIAQLLLAAGADVNAARNHLQTRPLHYAADDWFENPLGDADRQVAMLQLLLAAGASVDAADKNGATALHHAVRNLGAAAVRCLLAAGAAADLQNKSGLTPFHLAVARPDHRDAAIEKAETAQRNIIQAFLDHGADVLSPDAKGRTVVATARSAWVRQMLSGNDR